ncbi:MAG: hypothetical protein WA160_11125 [Pseudobdellovibrio sp.]
MTLKNFIPFALLMSSSLVVNADGLLCKSLFYKPYKATEFIIEISGKKESAAFLLAAHDNLVTTADTLIVKQILKQIIVSGADSLSDEQLKLVYKFRQNSSFLRSIFQTSEKNHASPDDFAKFVKDFGHLKDMLLINETAEASSTAKSILKKYKKIDFANLLEDAKPASKKSVEKYFHFLLNNTKLIMAKDILTVDEVHTVRKNLRDVLRYMQISNEVKQMPDTLQIDFLKKINSKLGVICDEYAAQIIRNELSKGTVISFPESLRPRVEYFLANYQVITL